MSFHKFYENWNKFLKEEEEINEVTEEELDHISPILHDLKPKDLPFGNMFGDKTRLIQPMMTKDENIKTLKELLEKSGYVPDFTTGKATYYTVTFPPTRADERPTTLILTTAQHNLLNKKEGESEEKYQERAKRIRKREVSIGKLLQKGSRLFDAAKKTQSEYEDERSKKASALAHKDFSRLTDVFPGMMEERDYGYPINWFKKLSEWWNKKSTFYRENPEAAEKGTTDDYSIVYSRHPIDVLRMSDHDNIESCHSPRSRGGPGEYYKCAVAEAHGHGAIAYVIKNEDLQNLVEEEEVEDIQGLLDLYDNEDKELFYDRERPDKSGDIEPVSRVRLRQYGHPGLGIRLMVPEKRIYGSDRHPSFLKQVVDWAKENQKDVIDKVLNSKGVEDPSKSAFKTDHRLQKTKMNLGGWERYGGSYQDTQDPEMFQYFFDLEKYGTMGRVKHDDTTEDSLELYGGIIAEWQHEVNMIEQRSNRGYYSAEIEGQVRQQDDLDGLGIDVTATFFVRIPKSEFLFSDSLQETGGEAIKNIYQQLNYSTHGISRESDWADSYITYDVEDGTVVIRVPLKIKSINPEGRSYARNPDDFQEIADAVKKIDEQRDDIESIVKTYLKKEGVMKGGAIYRLAFSLENEQHKEWEWESDGYDTNMHELTYVEVSTKQYVNLDDLIQKIPVKLERGGALASEGIKILFDGRAYRADDGEGNFKWWEVVSEEFENKKLGGFKNAEEIEDYSRHEIAKMILKSRDFHIAVRLLFRDAVGGVEGEFKYPYTEMKSGGMGADDEWSLKFTMNIDDDTDDDVVESAHNIIEAVDDEDELKDIFRRAFAKVAKVSASPTSIKEVKNYFSKYKFLLD